MKIYLPEQIMQDAQLSCCGKDVMRQKAVTQKHTQAHVKRTTWNRHKAKVNEHREAHSLRETGVLNQGRRKRILLHGNAQLC